MRNRRAWFRELALRRKKPGYPVVIAGHCLFEKMIPLNVDEERVESTVRRGSVFPPKCEPPAKLAFRSREAGRAAVLVVVTQFRRTHIKVITVYLEE